jgi:hypothetical protein
MSVAIYKHIRDGEPVPKEQSMFVETLCSAGSFGPCAGSFHPSPLEALSTQQRLSRILSSHPQPTDFEPFLIHGEVNTAAVTACVWAQDTEIDLLTAWTSRWPGIHFPYSIESQAI